MKHILFVLFFFVSISAIAQSGGTNNKRYVVSAELLHLDKDTQFDVRISSYNLRKIDANKRIVEFTSADAARLESFFMQQKQGIMACETHALDKTLKLTTKPDFDYKSVMSELSTMGYIVTNLRSGTDEVLFNAACKCNEKATQDILAKGTGCDGCGVQKIAPEILSQFKDADYGGNALDIDLNISTSEQKATDTNVTTSPAALEAQKPTTPLHKSQMAGGLESLSDRQAPSNHNSNNTRPNETVKNAIVNVNDTFGGSPALGSITTMANPLDQQVAPPPPASATTVSEAETNPINSLNSSDAAVKKLLLEKLKAKQKEPVVP